jgi:WD40 repeat protein
LLIGFGARLLTCGWDTTVRLWHWESGEELLNFRGFLGASMAAQFSADGRRLFAVTNYGEVKVWDSRGPE